MYSRPVATAARARFCADRFVSIADRASETSRAVFNTRSARPSAVMLIPPIVT
jgi:hypothetical protein